MQQQLVRESVPVEPKSPRDQVVSLLGRELGMIMDLDLHLGKASDALSDVLHPNIANLPRHLRSDLKREQRLVANRMESLAPGSTASDAWKTGYTFWTLVPEDGTDPRSHFEALVTGYARLMRSTSDVEAALKLLSDEDSVAIMKRLEEVGSRGLWFLEIYLEGLAVHMDEGHLPQWS